MSSGLVDMSELTIDGKRLSEIRFLNKCMPYRIIIRLIMTCCDVLV